MFGCVVFWLVAVPVVYHDSGQVVRTRQTCLPEAPSCIIWLWYFAARKVWHHTGLASQTIYRLSKWPMMGTWAPHLCWVGVCRLYPQYSPSPLIDSIWACISNCSEDKREDYQNCSVLCRCVTCVRHLHTMIRTHMSSSQKVSVGLGLGLVFVFV